MNQVIDAISDYYSLRIGLNPSALSRQSWEFALHGRMEVVQARTADDYYAKWSVSPAEMRHFLDKILVLETWFYREKEALHFLSRYAFNTWYPKHKRPSVLRILSLPCSTGEEPYSIAISLLRAGFPAELFEIEGIDISQLAIAKAELGIYGKSAFRGMNHHDLAFYFSHEPEGFKIAPFVKKQVTFNCKNVFDYAFLTEKLKVDIVFCRNLLIYLNPESQKKLFGILTKILNPDGIIIVGATESEAMRKAGFKSLGAPNVAAFYANKFSSDETFKVVSKEASKPLPLTAFSKDEVLLEKAKEQANQGKFDEATSSCLTYLHNEGPDPQGYYLLGVIMHASRKGDKAEEFFNKALYLDPEHYEALIYKSLLEEAAGNKDNAQRYRDRAERVKSQGVNR